MRPRTSVNYALFFIFLTLGHEFSSAYRVAGSASLRVDPLQKPIFQKAADKTSFPSFHDSPKATDDNSGPIQQAESIPSKNDNALQIYNEDDDEDDNNEVESAESVQVKKRLFSAIVLGVTIGVSIAGMANEIYLKIRGCCGYYPIACRYQREFKRTQKKLLALFPKIDFAAVEAKNLLESITHTNYRINEIWIDLKRINDLQTRIITGLSPETITGFNNKWAEIVQQLKTANSTIRKWTYGDLNTAFKSYFDDYKQTLLAMSGLFGYGLTVLAIPLFNSYKKRSLNKNIQKLSTGKQYNQLVTARHTKAAKLLGVSKVGLNKHIAQTAKGKNDARFKAQKYAGVLKGISFASALLTVGVEVYSAVMKVKQCKDVRDKAREGRDDIVEGYKSLKEVKKNVTNYISYIDLKGFQYIKRQLNGQNFILELEKTKKLAKGAGKQSVNMKNAATAVDKFIKDIKKSNSKVTLKLSTDLADGLAKVKFLYLCFDNRVKLINYVITHCKVGQGSLTTLFHNGSKSFNTGNLKEKTCLDDTGTPYLNLADLKKTMVTVAKKHNFNPDCILNSNAKKKEACRLYNEERYTKAQVASTMKLKVTQIEYFLARCKPYVLSKTDIKSICFMKNLGASAQAIYDQEFLPRSVTLKQIEAEMTKCPPKKKKSG